MPAPNTVDPEVIAEINATSEQLEKIGMNPKGSVPVQIGFDAVHQMPLYELRYPCVFNDDGTPYLNTEEDMNNRAKMAQKAASTRYDKVSNRDALLVTALTELAKRDANQSVAYIKSLPRGEQDVYVAAEKLGQKRKTVLAAFNAKPEENTDGK
jgi:hypothetical protein